MNTPNCNTPNCTRCGRPFVSDLDHFGPPNDECCFACWLQLCVWQHELSQLDASRQGHLQCIVDYSERLKNPPYKGALKERVSRELKEGITSCTEAIDDIYRRKKQLRALMENLRAKEAAA